MFIYISCIYLRIRKALFYYFASSTNTFYIFRQHSYIQKIIVKFTQENVKTLAILIKFPIGCLHRVPFLLYICLLRYKARKVRSNLYCNQCIYCQCKGVRIHIRVDHCLSFWLFFVWKLHCLSIFDLRFLITPFDILKLSLDFCSIYVYWDIRPGK
jgi:hypothetical protein